MTRLVRWEPYRELTDVRQTMDRVFIRSFGRPWRLVGFNADVGYVPVDLYETDEDVVVKASLPGVTPEDVEISVNDNTLTIQAETKQEEEKKEPHYFRHERIYGSFRRSLRLPVEVDAEKAEAVFEQGVLHLRLPKVAEARPKTIEVKAK